MLNVPVTLLREQTPMLKTLGTILVNSAIPGRTPSENPASFDKVSMQIAAPSDELVEAYIAWSGAPADRYKGVLPPHMFSQWALPVASVQLQQTRYKLSGIVNQGCDVKINSLLPAGQAVNVECDLVDITEANNRVRIHQRLIAKAADGSDAIEIDFFTAFVLGRGKKKAKPTPEKAPEFETVGTWDTGANDGLEFGILTGDLNPIHWITAAGKLSPFKAKVLHGFGMFVRSYEALRNGSNEDIAEIGVRFIKPVPLPSSGLRVCRTVDTDAEGSRSLELRDSSGRTLMVGSYKAAK